MQILRESFLSTITRWPTNKNASRLLKRCQENIAKENSTLTTQT